jgi:predicted transcriptional regulator
MLVRKQIVVSSEVDARIRRLARTRRVSQSRIVAEAVEALGGVEEQLTGVLAFAGTIKAAPRKLSEEVDKSLYR